MTRPDLQRLQRNDRAMIRQICNVKPNDVATVRSKKLLAQLEIDYTVVNLREKRLHWFVHVEQFSGAFKTVCSNRIEVERGPGRPKTTWMTLTDRDLREWKLNEFDPSDRDVLKPNGRSAMRAASQLPGGEPTDVDDAPAPARYI